jgi:hypothetical protein
MVIDRTPSNIQLDRLLGTNLPVAWRQAVAHITDSINEHI